MGDRTGVLVASADVGTRSQVRTTLGEERFDLREASDTDAAVHSIAAEVPQVLVVDLALPGSGALALARGLRSEPSTSGLRTLLLVDRGMRVPEDAAGIDETLALPVTGFALLRKVESLLDTV